MAEKEIYLHDTRDAETWGGSNHVPQNGEIIVYTYEDAAPDLKVGDGKTQARHLPFINESNLFEEDLNKNSVYIKDTVFPVEDGWKTSKNVVVTGNNAVVYPSIGINAAAHSSGDISGVTGKYFETLYEDWKEIQ
jgi:hypothetical protein